MSHEAMISRKRMSLHAIPPDAVFLGVRAVFEDFYAMLEFDFPPQTKPLARGRKFRLEEGLSPMYGEPLCTVELRVRKGSPELGTFYVYEVPVK